MTITVYPPDHSYASNIAWWHGQEAIKDYNQAKYKEALRHANNAIKTYVTSYLAQAYKVRGLIKLYGFDDTQGAIEDFQYAIQYFTALKEPEHEIHYHYGCALAFAGDRNAAILQYKLALDLITPKIDNKTLSFICQALASAQYEMGEISEAKINMDLAAKFNNQYNAAYRLAATYEYDRDNLNAALTNIKAAKKCEAAQDALEVVKQKGKTKLDSKNAAQAKQAPNIGVEIPIKTCHETATYYLAGLIYRKLGAQDKAIANFQKATNLRTERQMVKWIQAHYYLGKLTGDERHFQAVVEHAQAEIAKDKIAINYSLYYFLAKAYQYGLGVEKDELKAKQLYTEVARFLSLPGSPQPKSLLNKTAKELEKLADVQLPPKKVSVARNTSTFHFHPPQQPDTKEQEAIRKSACSCRII